MRPLARSLALALVAIACGCAVAATKDGEERRVVREIRSRLSSGEGSIRAAIEAANADARPTRIVSRLTRGTVVYVFRELPAIVGRDVVVEGAGVVLRGDDCVRLDGRRGCSGLVVEGEKVTLRDISATGFLFDGVSVRGGHEVMIRDSRFFRNSDDGIGISDAASGVTIEKCLLEDNGFRSKGKGVLVFDHSHAVLRENRIVGNRDGVTVSKRAHATLERNEIRDSYDKGLGIAGASADGAGNRILGSGAGRSSRGAGPNADGLRVTIDSSVSLSDTVISDSGDVGAVAAGRSRVDLVRPSFTGNRGGDLRVADDAVIVVDGREVRAEPEPNTPRAKDPRSR